MTGNDEVQPATGGGEGQPAAGAGATPGAGGADTKTKKSGGKAGRNTGIAVGVALLLVVVGAAAEPYAPGATEVKVEKNNGSGTLLNASDLENLAFTVTGGKLKDLEVTLDGEAIEGTQDGDAVVFRPTGLSEGEHRIEASAPGRLPGRKASTDMTFTVDTTAPKVTVDDPGSAPNLRTAMKLTGTVEGAKTLKINDEDVEIGENGSWTKEFDRAPAGARLLAVDEAGNETSQDINVTVQYPGMRAVHMTANAWATPSLREPVIELIKQKKIDAVQLDIKDEDGIVGYDSQVALAKEAGTAKPIYDAKTAVEEIHALGARVIGRIVAFRDPKLAGWAVQNGKMSMVIQGLDGTALDAGKYGKASFTNFANADLRQYNIDLGVEAAKHGFDDIMYDYIRRPESSGKLSSQVFPGIGERSPEEAVAHFVELARPPIREAGAFIGAAVYGVSSFTPFSVAQNIPMMAKHLDYVAPMVYPSHWGPGEYSVDSPNSQPYDIVHRSLKDFNRVVLGTGAGVIPWLQDFSLGVRYGAAEVRAQIKASSDAGINSWLLWNAGSRYTAAALDAREASGNLPKDVVYSVGRPGANSEGTKDIAEATRVQEALVAEKAAAAAGTTTPASPAPSPSPSPSASPSPSPSPTAASTEPSATASPTP